MHYSDSLDDSDDSSLFFDPTSNEPDGGQDLHKLICEGDHEGLRRLLCSDQDQNTILSLETRNSFGLTPLLMAIYRRDSVAVDLLAKAGSSLVVQTEPPRKTPLALAAFSGAVNVFELLVNQGASISSPNVDCTGQNLLHEAVSGGHSEMVEHIVKAAPELCSKANHAGRTPHHLAAFLNSPPKLVTALLKNALPQKDLKDVNGRKVSDFVKRYCKENEQVWTQFGYLDD